MRARQVRAAFAGALLLPVATGCYTYRPIWTGEPATGSVITLGLTDRGRVALSDRLGAGARTVTGVLTSATDSAFVISVSRVTYIDGDRVAKWNGEAVDVSKQDVRAGPEHETDWRRSAAAMTVRRR